MLDSRFAFFLLVIIYDLINLNDSEANGFNVIIVNTKVFQRSRFALIYKSIVITNELAVAYKIVPITIINSKRITILELTASRINCFYCEMHKNLYSFHNIFISVPVSALCWPHQHNVQLWTGGYWLTDLLSPVPPSDSLNIFACHVKPHALFLFR